jgi:hypothetical protein
VRRRTFAARLCSRFGQLQQESATMKRSRLSVACLIVTVGFAVVVVIGRAQPPTFDPEAYRARQVSGSARMESAGLAAPFKGVTTNGTVVPGLYPIRSTGVSTSPVVDAARRFLDALTAEQRRKTSFPENDGEWRKWANQHAYLRQGMSFDEMTDEQHGAATAMLAAALSAKGLQLTADIMRLNETLGELRGGNFVEYGEGKYWITVMGVPSTTEPWGWQLDGHHLVLNYFVLGSQVVMTPAFWGSEPAVAHSGKYAGTAVLQDEQQQGLAMVRALTDQQRARAILATPKTGNNILTQAFSDNVVLDHAGVPVSSFTAAQKQQLLDLIRLYVGNLRDEHARVHLADVEARLDDTYFAWIGETKDDSVYYYRIHSPVVLIEFDHETPVGLRHLYPPGVPYREHIHAIVRTPNGNDYGKNLLRQHYAQHPH